MLSLVARSGIDGIFPGYSEISRRSDGRNDRAQAAAEFFNGLLRGTYVAVDPDHLEAYVDEQVFRFNNRKLSDWQRFDRLMGMVVGKRLTYADLTGGKTR